MKYELWANHYSSDCRLVPKGSIISLVKGETWHAKEPSGVEYDFQIKNDPDGNSPLPSVQTKPLDNEARNAFKAKFPKARLDVAPPTPLSSLRVQPDQKTGDVPAFDQVKDAPGNPKAG